MRSALVADSAAISSGALIVMFGTACKTRRECLAHWRLHHRKDQLPASCRDDFCAGCVATPVVDRDRIRSRDETTDRQGNIAVMRVAMTLIDVNAVWRVPEGQPIAHGWDQGLGRHKSSNGPLAPATGSLVGKGTSGIVRQRLGALGGVLGTAEIVGALGRIGADDHENPAAGKSLVPCAGGQHSHVARREFQHLALIATELHPGACPARCRAPRGSSSDNA